MKRVPKFYLAAPFFNKEQLLLLEKIEVAMVDHDVSFFSPRFADKPGPADDAEWSRRFKANIDNLYDCDHVLAVADFKLPDGGFLIPAIKRDIPRDQVGPDGCTFEYRFRGQPVHLPDTGTVFEMGVQYGMRLAAGIAFCDRDAHSARKIVVYTERPLTETLNVMLTKSCAGVIHGVDELAKFLNNGDISWSVAGPWKGKTR